MNVSELARRMKITTQDLLEKLPAGAIESLPWAVLLHDIAKPVTAERDARSNWNLLLKCGHTIWGVLRAHGDPKPPRKIVCPKCAAVKQTLIP